MPIPETPRERPLVTVGMLRRSAETTRDAIESVLAQDFRDFELIVSEDDASHRVGRLIRRHPDRRIRRIRAEAPASESESRNRLLEAARGRYLIYIDGDDYAYPHGLGFMAEMLARFPEAAFACAQPSSQKFIYPVELLPHDHCACIFFGPSVMAADISQLMFQTSSLRDAGGFDPQAIEASADIQLRLGWRHSCVLVNNGLVWWRRRGATGNSAPRAVRVAAELARFAARSFADWECPLSAGEARAAQVAAHRGALRAIAAFAKGGQLRQAARLLGAARIPCAKWTRGLSTPPSPHFAEIAGVNPLRSSTIDVSFLPSPGAVPLRRLVAQQASPLDSVVLAGTVTPT